MFWQMTSCGLLKQEAGDDYYFIARDCMCGNVYEWIGGMILATCRTIQAE